MSFRFFRFLTISVSLAAFCAQSQAQTASAPTPSTPPSTESAPTAANAGTLPPQVPPGHDYPDPRTITFGLVYWFTNTSMGTQPGIFGGKTAPDYETIPNLGKPKNSPGFFLSVPITRTGEIKAEGFLIKGTGNQLVSGAPDPYDAGVAFNPGDYMTTQYQIKDVHIYLDDLLFPHKFPVAKLRFKSLWGVEWLGIHNVENTPLATSPVIADNSSNLVVPTFGLAMEYAVAKHVLFRVSTDGFAFPHKSVLGEAEGELSYRRGSFEIIGGEKFLHFKTSPNTTTYVKGTLIGAFAGVRWHF